MKSASCLEGPRCEISDREFYSLYLAPEALAASGSGAVILPPTLPVIERQWTDFSQGVLTTTGNPLDVALSGEGFFTVQGQSGLLFTRNGNFHLSSEGVLETAEGHAVLDGARASIQIDPTRDVEITPDGSLRQDGELVGIFGVVKFDQPDLLQKVGGTYFQASNSSAESREATSTELHQGKLENANFTPAEAAIRLVSVMRQFEMLQKALTLGAEMNRQAVTEVARVGS